MNKGKDGFSDASDGSFDGPEENLNTASEAGLGLCMALYPFTGKLAGLCYVMPTTVLEHTVLYVVYCNQFGQR